MNTLVSYNWLKEYLKTDASPAEFAKKTTNAGNSVEHMEDLSKRFEKVIVGEIKEIKPHPNADKLKVAVAKIGAKKTVEIVCGGSNLKEGQRVAVALPGAKVFWHGEEAMTELRETEIRGVKSFGMICAASELGFKKYPEKDREIWDLGGLTDASAGTSFAKAMGLEDVLFDIEVTTNRPDCKSIIGQAREGAAVTHAKFLWNLPALPRGGGKPFAVDVLDRELCPNYQAVLLEGVRVGPSPWWLQKRLLLTGHKPINNVVDVTNYVLEEYGQPMHAFDADTLEGEQIVVRRAKKGEKITALDTNTYTLSDQMLVIADAKKPIAIAGVMGGLETGTGERTTRVVLESATFDPISVRKTSRALNLYSDSSSLFEKGLSAPSTAPALARAISLLQDIAGARVASGVTSVQVKSAKAKTFLLDPEQVRSLMGVAIPDKEIVRILTSLGFTLTKKTKGYQVTVPYWRVHDIEHAQDFVEEVARVYGYERIPSSMPAGQIPVIPVDPMVLWERRAKEYLRGAGLSETYSFSFLSEQQLALFGLSSTQAVRIENPLSSDDAFMRPSLVPTMLTAIEQNQARFPEGALFEIAPVYLPKKQDIPAQPMELLLAVYGRPGEQRMLQAKGIVERLANACGIRDLQMHRLEKSDARFHPGRSAVIASGGLVLGTIGEISQSVGKVFGIDGRVTVAVIDFDRFVSLCTTAVSYKQIPTYQDAKRDLAIVLDERVEYANVVHALRGASGLLHEIELFDVYRGKGVEFGKKSLAMHLSFRSHERTLEASEVEKEIEQLTAMLAKQFSAILRT